MVNPKIVYCDKNHIYDAAIDKECPYCRKVEEEHRRLSKIVRDSEWVGEEEEYTELIGSNGVEEEYTELIGRESDEEEEYTELIKDDIDEAPEVPELLTESETDCEQEQVHAIRLQGWLVCLNGDDSGKSFELTRGENFVYYGQVDHKISVSSTFADNKSLIGLLSYQQGIGKFIITSGISSICKIDGTQTAEACILESYSRISLGQAEFVFVKFNNEKF